jgi:hypothetical protein
MTFTLTTARLRLTRQMRATGNLLDVLLDSLDVAGEAAAAPV